MIIPDIHTHHQERFGSVFNKLPNDPIPRQNFSWGLHPWYLQEGWQQDLDEIAEHSTLKNLVAIGECGFDLLKGPDVQTQIAAFTAQAKLAKSLGLPVILHCVKGLHLLQAFLKNNPESPAIIWHGYNQKPEVGRSLMSYPVYFSFGAALMKKGSNAQKFLQECPLDRIFFETDTSDVEISSVYKQASVILGLSVAELVAVVKDNWNHISKRKLNEG